ncbi:trypsin-1-like [Cloeon dipterum]|uniref:trypsin-1-like n=1 Tax=Cloeon dipterum TaxID=197152 RepID=UPI00322039A7
MKLLLCALAIFALSDAFVQKDLLIPPQSAVARAFNNRLEERVLGGTQASINEFPYMLAIISSKSTSGENDGFCGGSLISSQYIITAAHCLKQYTVHHAILGTLRPLDTASAGYTKIVISAKKPHEGFTYSLLDNDIALLTLATSAPTGVANIRPVLLPRRSFDAVNLVGRSGLLTGWGKINDDPGTYLSSNLLKVSVPIVENTICRGDYGSVYINDKKVCVDTDGGAIGACHGDSGGPLTYYDTVNKETVQIGVMNFGSSSGCQSGFRTVYTRVTNYTQWIANNGGPAVRT